MELKINHVQPNYCKFVILLPVTQYICSRIWLIH